MICRNQNRVALPFLGGAGRWAVCRRVSVHAGPGEVPHPSVHRPALSCGHRGHLSSLGAKILFVIYMCVCVCVCVCVCKCLYVRLSLFATPIDCSPPGPSVHGILQARTLEWVAISSPRGSFQPRSPALQADSLPCEPPGKSSDAQRLTKPECADVACVAPPECCTF